MNGCRCLSTSYVFLAALFMLSGQYKSAFAVESSNYPISLDNVLTELNAAYDKAGGGYGIHYNYHDGKGMIEICPDNLCNFYRFNVNGSLGDIVAFIYVHMYRFSGFTELENMWTKDPKTRAREIKIIDKYSQRYNCGINDRLFCVLENIAKDNNIVFGFVRYDEGERVEERENFGALKNMLNRKNK